MKMDWPVSCKSLFSLWQKHLVEGVVPAPLMLLPVLELSTISSLDICTQEVEAANLHLLHRKQVLAEGLISVLFASPPELEGLHIHTHAAKNSRKLTDLVTPNWAVPPPPKAKRELERGLQGVRKRIGTSHDAVEAALRYADDAYLTRHGVGDYLASQLHATRREAFNSARAQLARNELSAALPSAHPHHPKPRL